MTLVKSFLQVSITNLLYGTSKENLKPFLLKRTTKIACLKLDFLPQPKMNITPQSDGMEDLKFGPNSSNVTPAYRFLKNHSMPYQFLLTEFTLPLEEKTDNLKSGKFKISKSLNVLMIQNQLLMIVLLTQNSNG